jgi:hypothetical protein
VRDVLVMVAFAVVNSVLAYGVAMLVLKLIRIIKLLRKGAPRNDLLPPGPGLVRHNRRVLAERLNWPEGAVEACDRIDDEHPGWYSSYRHAYRDQPAGYYAHHHVEFGARWHVHGYTPDDLHERIRAHRCPAGSVL